VEGGAAHEEQECESMAHAAISARPGPRNQVRQNVNCGRRPLDRMVNRTRTT
jgi:hypothetical protein